MAIINVNEYLNFDTPQSDAPPPLEPLKTDKKRGQIIDVDTYLNFDNQDPDNDEVLDTFTPKKYSHIYDNIEERNEVEKLSYKDLSSDNDYMNMLRDYGTSRYGKDGEQEAEESNEDYIKRFVSHVRGIENNSVDLYGQLDWVRQANQEQRMQWGYLYSQLEKLPSFWEEGGDGYVRGIRDYAKALILDPINLIGFGVGKVVAVGATKAVSQALKEGGKKAALKEAAKYASYKGFKRPIVLGGAAIEGGESAVRELAEQEMTQLSGLREDEDIEKTQFIGRDLTDEGKDAVSAGAMGALGFAGGVLGGALGLAGTGKQAIKRAKKRRLDDLSFQKRIRNQKDADTKFQTEKALLDGYDPLEGRVIKGRKTLNELQEAGDLTQAELKQEIQRRTTDVVTEIIRNAADDGSLNNIIGTEIKASELITEIVANAKVATVKGKKLTAEEKSLKAVQETSNLLGDKRVTQVLDFEDLDTDVLEGALSRAGLTAEEFADTMATTVSDAGKTLQNYSQVGRIMKKLKEVDPAFGAKLDSMFSQPSEEVSMMTRAGSLIQRLDRERRALLVTQISTTVRNVATGFSRAGMEMSSRLIESSLFHAYRGMSSLVRGEGSVEGFRQGLRDIGRDAFGTLARVVDTANGSGETKFVADALLSHNRKLAEVMDRSLQEVGDKGREITGFTRALNGLNIAQDLIFRRAVFVDTIERQMRRVNLITDKPGKGQYKNINEFIASGKALPTNVLKEAVEDSLAFTFARMPKQQKGRMFDSIGHRFIKINEALGPIPAPLGTAAFPFARFMVNALQFQYEYSGLTAISGISNLASATKKAFKGRNLTGDAKNKLAMAESRDWMKAREDLSKAVVGTVAIYSGYKYREANSETRWYEGKTDDGRTVDLRPFFPFTPYLALGELLVQAGKKDSFKDLDAREILEGMTGAQFRRGAGEYMLQGFFDEVSKEGGFTGIKSEKLGEIVGGFYGELVGGAFTPLKVIRDINAAYDTEAAKVRDGRQTQGFGAKERGLSAFKNSILRNTPVLDKGLPELESPTREGAVYRQSPIIGQITGARMEQWKNLVEKELDSFNIKSYTIVPASGDKEADALVKKHMGILLEKQLAKEILSDSYQNKSRLEQSASLKNKFKRFRKFAKTLAKFEAQGKRSKEKKGYTPFDRVQFNKLSSKDRELANEYFVNKYGATVNEMQEANPTKNYFYEGKFIGRLLGRIAQ